MQFPWKDASHRRVSGFSGIVEWWNGGTLFSHPCCLLISLLLLLFSGNLVIVCVFLIFWP